ncbi:proline-rich transmembrane protein 3 isoform X1 [Ascaphus truei]|uniref:proline-rich transmembrane protein 3 isoform X1 n=1 Tax=Ascaphus truei TaxID=8439 RepID=UPI003F595152
MAESVLLQVWIVLAALAVIEPSTFVSEFDKTNAELTHELTEGNPTKNDSDEPSENNLEVKKMAASNVFRLEESMSAEDLYYTKPPSAPAVIQGGKVAGNVKHPPEKGTDGFLDKEEEKVVAANLQMYNEMSPVSTVRPGLEETETGNNLMTHPSISEMHELNSKGKSSTSADKDNEWSKLQSIDERPSFHTMDVSLKMENDIETVTIEKSGREILSTSQSTISTIALLTTPRPHFNTGEDRPITQIQKLQIESGDEWVTKELSKNFVEAQDDFLSHGPDGSSDAQRGAAENNFLDDNLIPKVHAIQPSEKYNAAYRTTESYSTLQGNVPGGNEVISADVELLQADDKLEYQKDSNTILVESMEGENETVSPHFSAFLQPKQTVAQVSDTHTPAIGPPIHLFPSTLPLKQELSTLLPSVTKDNLPHATVVLRKHITLEAKARTQMERVQSNKESSRQTTQESLTAQNGFMVEETNEDEVATNLFPYSTDKADSHDILLSSLPPHKTPTPAMQVLGKNPNKLQELEQSSAQPGKGSAGPLITQRSPLADRAPPGLVMSTTWRMFITRQPDPIDLNKAADSSPPQLGDIATPQISLNATKRSGRRGEIRVTTQRALQRPRLIETQTHFPSKKPTTDPPLCTRTGGTCAFLGSNKTLLKWEDLHRTLSFAWDMHVYGTGVLFVLLSVIAIINLIGSPILRVSYLPFIITSNALLFIIGILRATFFLVDPYGTKSKFSHGVALVLYNVTFPLILTTFATLVLLVLKIACLQLLPSKFQSLPLLAVVGVIHFIILLSADLLTHLLNPSVNVVLQILSISWGIFLMVGNLVAYYRLRRSGKDIVNETQRVSPACEDIVVVQTQARNIKCLFTLSRVLLVCSIFGLLCCGLQLYAVLWLYGLLGKRNEFSWSWWFLQFWYRLFELALCFSLIFVASHTFCQQCSSSDHTCWSKIISYFCTYRKTEVPEYPNNCYDWTNNLQDRVTNNNISKSLIRNQPENVPLRILKENNENKTSAVFCNHSGSSSPLVRSKPMHVFGPKSQNVTMGRSHTSICFEKDSILSLTDLEFRPPSPINLSRSIDEALFREHLVRDSIFLDSSLQYPSYLCRQDSCSSLKECSALNQTVDPLLSSDLKMRRCSSPDYMYSLARCSSLTDMESPCESLQQSKDLPHDITTEAVASISSLDSVSKGSIKISWNPWRHGLSSMESLPLEDTPSTQPLQQDSKPSNPSKGSESEKTLGKRLIERSQTTDSHSIASDTIEL